VLLKMKIEMMAPSMLNSQGLQTSMSATTDQKLSFDEMLRESFRELNQLQFGADQGIQEMVVGKTDDIHSVMIAIQKAQISLQFAVQVRNKLVEAYQEIMRMQV
jgi:flagellar hook-basal body complex protein FliE